MNAAENAKAPIAPTKGASKDHTKTQAQFSAKSTATEAQRYRILEALRRRPQTTVDLRRMGIFQAATRIKELRDRFGHKIETQRVTVVDADGFSHAGAALYCLVDGQQGLFK